MKDAAHAATDRQIAALERRLVKLYAKAEKRLQERVAAYFEQFAERDAEKRRQLANGEITEAEFVQWRLAQIARGKEFEKLRDAVADEMLKTNREAADMTAEAMPAAYVVNYNQEADEINREEGAALPLLLTAAALALSRPMVKKKEDIAWNRRTFKAHVDSVICIDHSAAITTATAAKRHLRKVSREITRAVTKRNETTARTNTRTFMTTAETKARQSAYKAADALGIHRVKTWYTVHDNKVRDAHAAMDGVSVPWTENFIVDGYEMIGPGDRSAPPYLWYNCRCRMKSERRYK